MEEADSSRSKAGRGKAREDGGVLAVAWDRYVARYRQGHNREVLLFFQKTQRRNNAWSSSLSKSPGSCSQGVNSHQACSVSA